MTRIAIKRAYDPPAKSDGYRVLVDRVWPRGVSKEALHLDQWAKVIAPTTALRQWFGHDPERWVEFQKRYRRELQAPEASEAIDDIVARAKGVPALTLVYGAADTQYNQAVVLRNLFEQRLGRR